MDKEVLECALKRNWKDCSVRQVLRLNSSPAVEKNVNFLSTISRLIFKAVLGNGRMATRSLIVKDAQLTQQMAIDCSNKYNVFMIETMIYTTVIKEMEYLLEEFEDTEGVLWCQLLHHVPYTSLVFEDLNACGFNMMKRGVFYDLDHTMILMHALGRFHGMWKVLEERGLTSQEGYSPWFVFNDSKLHEIWTWNIKATVRGLKKYWSPTWLPILDKIKLTEDELHKKMKQIGILDKDKFKVLNHGDCHKYNIMFKYDWKERPIELRFLDFQLPYYGSPCCDLTYALYLGPDPFVRRNNYNLLLQTYHKSLLKTLEKFKFSGNFPDLEELKELMNEYSFFGLYMFITGYPGQRLPEQMDDKFDMEKIMETKGEDGYNLEIFNQESLEITMGPDVEKFVTQFF